MNLAMAIAGVSGIIASVFYFWDRAAPESERAGSWRSFTVWVLQGVVAPALVWSFFNCGLLNSLPGLTSQIALLRRAGSSRAQAIVESTVPVLWLIASYWAAVTIAWLMTRLAHRLQAEQRLEFRWVGGIWSALTLPIVAWMSYASGGLLSGLAVSVWLCVLVYVALTLVPTREPRPMYSRAVARIKFGKYKDAEWEVINQLEKFEDDFEGWMMLAELYAKQFKDLAAADQTIRDLCVQPNLSAVQISVALHRLADWYLTIGENPTGARRALEELCQRFPGTHVERMSRQRIAQLPKTRDEMHAQQKSRTIRMPVLSDEFDEPAPDSSQTEVSRDEAMRHVNRFIERLKKEPNDVAAREKLAHILAEQLHEFDTAVEQMQLLRTMPKQPPQKLAEWLSRAASWRLQQGDAVAARVLLEQIIDEYPQSPQGFSAQRRLLMMQVEDRYRRVAAAQNAEL